jgi:hypothetical protein
MQSDSSQSKMARYGWLIPLVMLALASLACNDIAFPPPMVDRVEAQSDTAGRAYARVINVGLTYDSPDASKALRIVYETEDYGLNWHRTEYVFAVTANNSFPMEMYSDTLHLKERSIWTYPRSIFRGIFYDTTTQDANNQFILPYKDVSNSVVRDTIYIAMGTQGVLVGKLDDNGIAPDWHLSTNGMDTLKPLPLTISEPTTILGIIALILVVPPFALIHAYLLQRIWVYLLPALEARRLALKVTAGLVVLAIIGAVVWLTNEQIDLYPIIGVMTLITVIVGVTLTLWLAQQKQVSDYTRKRLAVAAFLVSLIVPGGVAAIFAMWWLVFGLVFCYWAYHRAYWRYIIDDGLTPEGRIQRWLVDRLAIEMVVIITIGVAAIIIEMALVPAFTGTAELIQLLGLGLGFGGLRFLIQHYSSQRAKAILMRDPDFESKRELRRMSRDLWLHTVYWIALAVILTGLTFAGQAMAYTWFITLLKTKLVL